ncbi:hypothetical protein X793_06980 [Dehalococcoides mccartyi CG4]|nr:hypothetical protein X793_06980 [Dehalococcoides mccartyi CG4]
MIVLLQILASVNTPEGSFGYLKLPIPAFGLIRGRINLWQAGYGMVAVIYLQASGCIIAPNNNLPARFCLAGKAGFVFFIVPEKAVFPFRQVKAAQGSRLNGG